MKQVWVSWEGWECYREGMWRRIPSDEFKILVGVAVEFTGDHIRYGAAMGRVIFAWPKTMLHNLTNPSINHTAFVGHCAACFEKQLPESVTRAAWAMLTDRQRVDANQQAGAAISAWKVWHINKGQYKIEFPNYDEDV